MTCAVVIPVYKAKMSDIERVSFEQCLSILGPAHPIYLVTYSQLDIGDYESLSERYGVNLHTSFFSRNSFKSIHSYNCLMLSPDFYFAFKEFDYILIYQLDAYVFEDRLTEWCEKGYDYIGGPIFAHHSKDINLATVGNGGFSLRRVDAFLQAVSARLSPFVHRKPNPYINFQKRFLFFHMLLFSGRCQKLRGFFTFWVAEDSFFSFALKGTSVEMNVPSAKEATSFAFDLHADVCYQINNENLPFGCHQWTSGTFWKSYEDFSHVLTESL